MTKTTVKPFPPMLPGETATVSAELARHINDHCQKMHEEIVRLSGRSA